MLTTKRITLAVFFLFALLFLLLLGRQPYPGSFVVKALPILSLALLALRAVPGRVGKLLTMALLFSAAGDVTLDLDREGLFVAGLGFFLVAHLFYIAAFARDARWRTAYWPAIILLLLYVGILTTLLLPNVGTMTAPVLAYIVAISGMGLTAACRRSAYSLVVLTGAFAFILSDSLIAIDKFLVAIPAGSVAIMITYYSAQFLISYGMVQEAAASGHHRMAPSPNFVDNGSDLV